MNVIFFVGKKYFFSRKSPRAINVISLISVIAVTLGTSALIIVLSVFNGFETLVKSLYNSFDPDIKITAIRGKTFSRDLVLLEDLKKIQGVKFIVPVIEDNALLRYHDRQYVATIKGVTPDFIKMTGLDTMIIDGTMLLQHGDTNFAVVGSGIAYNLNLSIGDFDGQLSVYIPEREKQIGTSINPEDAFNRGFILPAGVFSIQQDFDTRYLLVPLRFAEEMTGYGSDVTSVEIGLGSETDKEKCRSEIQALVGDKFLVQDRFQQHELLYKIMKSEKWAVYLILTLILIVAVFNLAGSLTMLIISKQKDIAVMQSMGADTSVIRKIFLTNGLMIAMSGAVAGMVIGFAVCWLQLRYGIVSLGDSGTFVISMYPVEMQLPDFIYIFLTVVAIGLASALYPSLKMVKQEKQIKVADAT